MTFGPPNSLGNRLSEQFDLPEDYEERFMLLKRTLESHATMINRKDTGQYEGAEVNIGQTFPGTTQQDKRTIFRKIVDFGALPNNATKLVAHGLANFANIIFTRIYGVGTAPGAYAVSVPYVDVGGLARAIQMVVLPVEVEIVTQSDWSDVTSFYVILEFYRT